VPSLIGIWSGIAEIAHETLGTPLAPKRRMTVGRLLAAWGVAVVGTAVACGAARSRNVETNTAGGTGGAADAGGESHVQAGETNDAGGVGGAGGSDSLPQAGGEGGGCDDTWLESGGAGGEVRLPGCLTLQVPETPFLVDAMTDPGAVSCDCSIGPWLMIFRTRPDGDLEGALVSTKKESWPPGHEMEASAFDLRADGNVYRLPPRTRATLATYSYDEDRVPGLCLTGKGLAENDAERDSVFAFYDEDGDGVADGVNLGGRALGLGDRGGDYEDDCGYESFPLKTRGHVADTTVHLTSDGDVLQPRLVANDGFLKEGSAWVWGKSGFVAAQPLTISGFIYGYAANTVLEPGAALEWRFDAVDSFDRSLTGELAFGQSEFWLKVRDGGFESFDDGEEWGTEDGRIEATCNPTKNYPYENVELPPIAGARSFVLDANSHRDRFRFSRGANETRLSFVAFGKVEVELATVGMVGGPPFRQTPVETLADCGKYAAFCAAVPAGTLKQYAVALPPGDSDVLVRLYNADKTAWASAGGSDLCVDDLILE
jgi:hypothetical protein